MLMWGGIAALVLIVAAVIFGLSLGIWFSVAMIALAGGSILYQTQQIMARHPSNAHVGAAVQMCASEMMLFWYVLPLLPPMLRCLKPSVTGGQRSAPPARPLAVTRRDNQ